MSAVTRPRGPLPPRVYWTRRALVLVVLLALLYGVARLYDAMAGDGTTEPEAATPVAGTPTAIPTPVPTPTAMIGPTAQGTAGATSTPDDEERAEPRRKRLPKPDGPCADSDVLVEPVIEDAHLNEPIEIGLAVRTAEAAACYWEVNPESVFLTIADEERTLWTSQQCPGSLPTEQVVARRTKPATVTLRWNGKESDVSCSDLTPWVLTGSYTATAIARGSVVPTETELVLLPARPVKEPVKEKEPPKGSERPADRVTERPSGDPHADPQTDPQADPQT
jgi:hypothetical protein